MITHVTLESAMQHTSNVLKNSTHRRSTSFPLAFDFLVGVFRLQVCQGLVLQVFDLLQLQLLLQLLGAQPKLGGHQHL
jgi:hypothetical protein